MLCSDPKGERIFSDDEDAAHVSTMLGGTPPLREDKVDSLKKKIKNMEDVITEYEVHICM